MCKYAPAEERAANNQKMIIRHFGFTKKVYGLPFSTAPLCMVCMATARQCRSGGGCCHIRPGMQSARKPPVAKRIQRSRCRQATCTTVGVAIVNTPAIPPGQQPKNYLNAQWLCERAILAPRNDCVAHVNNQLLGDFPCDVVVYKCSRPKCCDRSHKIS